jgi:cytochrome c oxidase subunit 3
MWVFLLTEVMFFGGMFAGYIVYRTAYPEAWALGSNTLDVVLGGLNTGVLIGSSLTMALAVHAAQTGSRKLLILFLILTILFGGVFLGVKAVEYSHKFHEHHVPGPSFHFEGEHAGNVQLFFSFYFAMTGMHALHMVIGIGILFVLVGKAVKGRFTAAYFNPVEMFGLYWHFVDIIWIFLYPLLYLVGRH